MKRPGVLRSDKDFSRLRTKGRAFHGKYLIFVILANNQDLNRKAFLASKKIGNSVKRHRAVRLMRESFRLIEKEKTVRQGYDFLFIAKASVNDLKCADVKKDLEAAMFKAKVFETDRN